MGSTQMPLDAAQHEQCARALFNFVWALLEKPDRSADETDLMIHACHASRLHWSKVGTPVNFARGEWQLSRVYAVAGVPQRAIHHASRCLEECRDHGLGDFDLAFAYEALARAHAVAGNAALREAYARRALDASHSIADEDDRRILLDDLGTIPPAAAGPPRLYRVILPVSDIDAAQVFYHRVLGIPGERVSPGRHDFDCGGTILACYDPQAEGDDAEVRPNPDQVYLAVGDLEAAHRGAAEAGCVWLEQRIETQPWGERSFSLRDPFGNPICFVDAATVSAGGAAPPR
jgi:uncharacterized glyoxalase superfamily protein PhnB